MDTEHGPSAPHGDGAPTPPPPAAGSPGAASSATPPPNAMPAPPPPPYPTWGAEQDAVSNAGLGGQPYQAGPYGYGPASQGPGDPGYGPGYPSGHGPGGPSSPPGNGPGYPAGYGPGGPGYPAGYGPGGPGYPPGYGPGGPGGPGYFGGAGGPGQPPRPRRRRGLVLAAVGTALALAAGGTAWATVGGTTHSPMTASAIASRTNPGLVDITTTIDYSAATAEGTGMVLTSDGEVLTNNHVIAGATDIKVRDIGNGRTYPAKVVGYSDSNDVAVLKLQGASGLPTVSIGSSSGLAVGQKVVALGNAEGKGGTPAVATGSITGLGSAITAEDQGSGTLEHLSDMIRTNADIEPGDSGGPLVNAAGKVIGMDTAASTSNGTGPGTTAAMATTAFAIPINRAMSIADQIEAGKSSSTVHIGATAFLGVSVSSQSGQGGFGQPSAGATIQGVLRGTPAAQAGLAAGDTITSVGGHGVAAASDLQGVIERYHPGDKVSVSWTDQFGQSHTATVTLVSGPAG
jgi:S1-C subfamily serine protease